MSDLEILFVDDDKDILFIVERYLSRQGYKITVVDNGIDALGLVKEKEFDIVFTDFKMPEFDGLELLAAIKEYRPETEVVIVTGYGTMESAIQAMKFGSYDYIQKPFKLDVLKTLIDRISEERDLRHENVFLKQPIRDKQRHRYGEIFGMSLRMQEVYETLDRIHLNPATLYVIIQGESGTGKELVARAIHSMSERKAGPFVPVNCSGFNEDISDEKFFDYLFGIFEAAEGGNIYLDEITGIASSFQDKMFKVLKDKKIKSSGRTLKPRINAGVIAASKMDLEEAVDNGMLNTKLYDLLKVVSIRMPPLRERKEDICLLLNYFLYQFNLKNPRKIACFSPEAMDILLDYHWPGNVIQLGNVIERAFATGVEGIIEVSDLPPEIKTFGAAAKRK